MGTLRPFQLGIHTVQPWHVKIVYKVLLTNMRDATRVVMLIGCAIAKQNVSADYQRKLEISMKNNRIKIFHPRNYQLLEKDDRFSYNDSRTVTSEEVHCLSTVRQLQASMLMSL